MDDLISRQTDCVLSEFGNCSYSETGCADCEVKANIRNALSAYWKYKLMYVVASRWFPCSEGLPEKPCYCLTSNEYSNVCEDFYWGEDGFEKANRYHYEVLAWQPLPEPYRGGEKE